MELHESHMKDWLTVIIITYKQKDYLCATIDSVLSQNYENVELIIADDGTPNFDVDSIRTHIDKGKRDNLKAYSILYDGKNRGTVRNINRALAVSQGEYIKLIGGDDTYCSNNVFSYEVAALCHDSSMLGVVSKSQQCDAFMNPIIDVRVEKSNKAIQKVLSMDYDEARKYIAKNDIFPIAVQAMCFKWRFFEINGFCDEKYVVIDDSPTVLKVLKCHKNIGFVDRFSVNHRSDVGISTSKELFAPRRLKYYLDCVTYGEEEIKPNPKVYGRIYSAAIPQVNKYVYEMALSKSKSEKNVHRLILTIKYSGALCYYFLLNVKKVINRINKQRQIRGLI